MEERHPRAECSAEKQRPDSEQNPEGKRSSTERNAGERQRAECSARERRSDGERDTEGRRPRAKRDTEGSRPNAERNMEGRRPRAKRDPEGRRRAIIEAAASLIAQEGTRKLTHRRVAERAGVPLGSTTQYFSSIDELRRAGIAELARLIDRDYDEMFRQIEEGGGTPQAFARAINDYLADRAQIEADTSFCAAAINDPEMRQLAQQAFITSVERSLPYLDETRAIALTLLLDGAMLDTCLLGEPVDPEAIDLAMQAIFATKFDPGNANGQRGRRSL